MINQSLFSKHLNEYELEHSSNIVSCHDANGNYLYVNDRVSEIAGYSTEELLGTSPYSLLHPEDRHLMEQQAHTPVLKGNFVKKIQYRFLAKCGDYKWFESSMIPVRENDVVSHIISITKDIHHEWKLKNKLQGEKKIYEDLSDAANIGHWSYDVENETVEWSKKIYEIHGLPKEANINYDTAMGFYHESSKNKLLKAIDQALTKGVEFRLKLAIRDAQSKNKWVQVFGTPLMRFGKCIEIFGVTQDITQSEKANYEKIFTLSEYLDGQNKLLKEFSQITSHDLRGPAVGLQSLIDEFHSNDGKNCEELIPYFKEKIDELFEKLDYLSKITAGSTAIEHSAELDLNEILDEILEKKAHLLEEHDILFTREIKDWEIINYNPIRMKNIIGNIIDNAINFRNPAEANKQIKIGTILNDRYKIITVEDNGLGYDLNLAKKNHLENLASYPKAAEIKASLFMTRVLVESGKGKLDICNKSENFTLIKLNLNKYKFDESFL